MLKGFFTPGGNRTRTRKNWVLNPSHIYSFHLNIYYILLIFKYLINFNIIK